MFRTRPIKIAIAGFGKIAQDQHLPALGRSGRFELVAVASPGAPSATVPAFPSVEELLATGPAIDAVAVCTPPSARHQAAVAALRAGKHVLLEKPPAMTLAEAEHLKAVAEAGRASLFAAWHSRFAAGVEPARRWLAERTVARASIVWREDVRVWHPGQRWIWEPGGFGVFDPGINALSVLTRISPSAVFLRGGVLEAPSNCSTPIRARLVMQDAQGAPITADFDFLHEGPPDWRIAIDTDSAALTLDQGGATLAIDGSPQELSAHSEYDLVYARFAALIEAGRSEVDLSPMHLVSDAFAVGERRMLPPFEGA